MLQIENFNERGAKLQWATMPKFNPAYIFKVNSLSRTVEIRYKKIWYMYNKIPDITSYFFQSQWMNLLCFVKKKIVMFFFNSWYDKISDITIKISCLPRILLYWVSTVISPTCTYTLLFTMFVHVYVGLFCDDAPLWKCKAELKLGSCSLGNRCSLELFPSSLGRIFKGCWNSF